MFTPFLTARKQSMRQAALWLAFAFLGVVVAGCQKYGKVGQETSEFAAALYTACSRKDPKAIEQIANVVEESASKGVVTSNEAEYLREIVRVARSSQWDRARDDAKRILTENTKSVSKSPPTSTPPK